MSDFIFQEKRKGFWQILQPGYFGHYLLVNESCLENSTAIKQWTFMMSDRREQPGLVGQARQNLVQGRGGEGRKFWDHFWDGDTFGIQIFCRCLITKSDYDVIVTFILY